MTTLVSGGRTTYGHAVGILMNDSSIPRIPGDPGHAETFSFPVVYEILTGFPFEDAVAIKKDHVNILITKALALQEKRVRLIAADCGLFGPYHEELNRWLTVPFIGSALDIVPLIRHLLPCNQKVGVITGDTRMLTQAHLKASGIDPHTVVISGMENSPEFRKVVIERTPLLDIDMMRKGVIDAAMEISGPNLGAVVLECTNLISFRIDIQNALKVPVFDLVSLIEFYMSGMMPRHFRSCFTE